MYTPRGTEGSGYLAGGGGEGGRQRTFQTPMSASTKALRQKT